MTSFHCQICEREIKASKGSIAHHGYQRPGQGWQTASCCGAKFRPYEVSCDRIPYAIEAIKGYIEREEAFVARWTAQPPRGIEGDVGHGSYKVRATALRPLNFDKKPDYRFGSYATLYLSAIAQAESGIRHARFDLDRLTKRLANWKPRGD